MSGSSNPAGIVPASLSFLAIYNPSLSHSDESLHDQIVYYYSKPKDGQKSTKSGSRRDAEDNQETNNERLRQIGLAQGMVQFAASDMGFKIEQSTIADLTRSGFSDGAPVDSVETEKSRIIIHNLETEWWLLAVNTDAFGRPEIYSQTRIVRGPDLLTSIVFKPDSPSRTRDQKTSRILRS